MPPETKTAGPRERLLETASRLFYEQGYLDTGINQLVEEAQIAKASFYQHFASKEALCEAYLAGSHARWNHLLETYLAHYDDPRDRLLGLFDFLREWKQQVGFRGCSFLNIVAEIPDVDSPLRAHAARHYDVFRADVRQLVAAYAAAYRPDIGDAAIDDLAEGFVLLFEGATVSSQNHAAAWPIDAARKTAELLLSS